MTLIKTKQIANFAPAVEAVVTNMEGIVGTPGPQGPVGPAGQIGPQGLRGNPGGESEVYTYSTTTTDADPGNGNIRFNASELSLATEAYIDTLNASGGNVTAWLDSINASTSTIKAILRVSRFDNSGQHFHLFYISGVLSASGYRKLVLSYIGGTGTLNTQAGNCMMTISRTGEPGPRGLFGGESQPYTFATATADSNPGSGVIRVNNADFSLSTQIFISNSNAAGSGLLAWLSSLGEPGNAFKAVMGLVRADNPAQHFHYFYVTQVTSAGGYHKLTVAYIGGNGSLNTSTGNTVITVSRFGNQGLPGPTGPTGPQGEPGEPGNDGLVTSVNGVEHLDGDITLSTDDIPEGISNQYHTAQRAIEALSPSGTIFPSNPLPYQRFYRTDWDEWCYWDPTREKWLGELKVISFASSATNVAAATLGSQAGSNGNIMAHDICITGIDFGGTTSPQPSGTVTIRRFVTGETDIYSFTLSNEPSKILRGLDINFNGAALLRVHVNFTSDTINQPECRIYYRRRA